MEIHLYIDNESGFVTGHSPWWSSGQDPVLSLHSPTSVSGQELQPCFESLQAEVSLLPGCVLTSSPCWAEAPARHRAGEGPDLEERGPRDLSPTGLRAGEVFKGHILEGSLRGSVGGTGVALWPRPGSSEAAS